MIRQKEKIRNILATTEFMLDSMTKAERKAAEYVLANPAETGKMSIKEFSQACGAGQATIMRMCRLTGAEGFSEYKEMLAYCNAHPMEEEEISIPKMDSMSEIIENVFKLNILTLKRTLEVTSTENYRLACDAVADSRKICFFALGDAMFPCNYACLRFRKIGYECYCDTDPDIQIINACKLTPGDVVVAVSHSGRSIQVLETVKEAKRNGAFVIGITKSGKSEFTKYCDTLLFTETLDNTVDKEIVARRVAEQAILDVIYLGVVQRMDLYDDLKKMADRLAVNKNPDK